MSESRKNHLTIDGGQVKEDDKETIGSYKPIPQGDGDFRKSPSRKSLEKASPDGASERLLQETDHPKIATRIDMTDAKYVVGDHRNGDAKVELDANKKRPRKHGSRKRHRHKREKTEEDKPKEPKEDVDRDVAEAEEGQGPSGTQDRPQGPSGNQDRRDPRDKEDKEHRKHRHRHRKKHHHRKHRPKDETPEKEEEKPLPNINSQRLRRMSFHPGTFAPGADETDSDEPKQNDEDAKQIKAFLKRFEEGRVSHSESSYVQFTGLTKEELMRYQDDPFWVRLRWTLFTLFWLLWLCMLAGAITIILRTPKCAVPKTWDAKGPIVAMTDEPYSQVEAYLPKLNASKIAAVLVKADSYTVLEDNDKSVEQFKSLLEKAKEYGVKLIVELIPNYVGINSTWFIQSENRSAQYDTYFTWANSSGFDELNNRKPPNGWIAPTNKPAWKYSDIRGQYYLQQFDENTADLNFANHEVVKHFNNVLIKWMEAGASGVRLRHARHIFFYPGEGKLSEEQQAPGRAAGAADHTMYGFWRHEHTRDLPPLSALLQQWAATVKQHAGNNADVVFTVSEDGSRWSRDNSSWGLRPLSAEADLHSIEDLRSLNSKLQKWPALHFKSADSEVALFSLLLPATPVLDIAQLQKNDNETGISKLVSLRSQPSIVDGHWRLEAVNSTNTDPLIAIVRWKGEHTGYVGVYNPGSIPARATLDRSWAPSLLTVHHVSADTYALNNYTINSKVSSDNVLVPPKSTVVLSFVPKTSTEK